MLGLSLFFGEALLTPAITVLAAVEGLRVEEPALEPLILPISLLILIGLFAIQSRGTGKIGRMLGPIILVWFIAIGVLGLRAIIETPDILWALNPAYGIVLFVIDPHVAFLALGSIVLAVTGSEALFADLGHFGAKPIRTAWLYVVLPGLVLNYFGQGAAILRNPANLENPFFILASGGLHYPMVVLATLASVIASQAVITAVFSITKQAVQLGLLPRMESPPHLGDRVRADLRAARQRAAARRRDRDRADLQELGRALERLWPRRHRRVRDLDVPGDDRGAPAMEVEALGRDRRVRHVRHRRSRVLLLHADANSCRARGCRCSSRRRADVHEHLAHRTARARREGLRLGPSIDTFLDSMEKPPLRVAGTAVFITPRLDEVPGALLHNMKHNKVLHERVIFLRVDVQDVPFVPLRQAADGEQARQGLLLRRGALRILPDASTCRRRSKARAPTGFRSTSTRRRSSSAARRWCPRGCPRCPKWRTKLFIKLYESALEAAQFYRLPPGRVVELGSQTEI